MTDPLSLGVAFVFGTLFGSFLNAVIHRLPRDVDVFRRSFCPGCGETIPWYRNVPILSWILLRGRCADCDARISVRYPLVELAGGVILTLALWRWGLGWSALSATLFAYVMVVLALIDADHRILPNVITLPGAVVGFLLSFPDPRLTWWDSLLGALLGGGMLFAVAWLYLRLRGREGMGMGDVKMMLLVGTFLGWRGAFMTVFIGSLVGSLLGVLVISVLRKGWEYALPFGTFLAIAAVVVQFWGPELLRWYMGVLGVS